MRHASDTEETDVSADFYLFVCMYFLGSNDF